MERDFALKRGYSAGFFDKLAKIQHEMISDPDAVLEYSKLKQNWEKVRYTTRWLTEKGLFPSKSFYLIEKSYQKAMDAKTEGNKYFQQQQYTKAMECYNEALCFAPVGSESMAIAYANRSAVYAKLNFFKFAVENIDLALENDRYPERLTPKLLDRKKECLEKMKHSKDAADEYCKQNPIKLSYAANSKIPFVADVLKFAKNDKYGRHIVTTKNLKPGDIVMLEEPFHKSLRGEAHYTHCMSCAKCNFFNLKPCPKSTAVMFCSNECATKAWDQFYQYEYPVTAGILTHFPQVVSNQIRIACQAFTLFESSQELKDFIGSIDVENEHPLNIDYTKDFKKAQLRAAYCLNNNNNKRKILNNFGNSVTTSLVWCILKRDGKIRNLLKTTKEENLFLHLMKHFGSIMDMNHTIFCNNFDHTTSVGSMLSPTFSLINHSCHPNTRFVDETNVLIITRPVKAGQQLFYAYSSLRHTENLIENRIPQLLKRHYFICDCEACTKKYPRNDKFTMKAQMPSDLADLMYSIHSATKCDNNLLEMARKGIAQGSEFLMKNYSKYPCLGLDSIQTSILYCLHILIFEFCEDPLTIWQTNQ